MTQHQQGARRLRIGDGVVGADGYLYTICWDIAGVDLTDATSILGTRRNLANDEVTPLVGTITAPTFNTIGWALNSGDVLEEGLFEVQFTAEIGGEFYRNVASRWQVWAGNEANQPPPPPDPPLGITTFIRVNTDGTYSFLEAADFRTAIGVGTGTGDMPLIDPAVAGNLAIQAADGSLVDAGYAAEQNTVSENSIVQRGVEGGILTGTVIVQAGPSATFDIADISSVWGIRQDNGVHVFIGPNEVADRAAQRREILAADQRPAQTDIAGTTHTFALTNENQIVASQSGSATTFTIPLNSVAAFAIGSIIGIEQQGAGVLSVEATAGVTLNGVSGATIALTAQWGAAALRKIATNSWIIIGAI